MQQLNLLEDIDEQTKPPGGNRTMVRYGIREEGSHFRVHVCYPIMRMYVFSTDKGRGALMRAEREGLRRMTVLTGDIPTAYGYAIPISWIEGISDVLIPLDLWKRYPIERKIMVTSQMGQLAAYIVYESLLRNLVPLPVQPNHADTKALQIEGTDILINAILKLQVKCDMPGGDSRYCDLNGRAATGNLFIQTDECNPYKRY